MDIEIRGHLKPTEALRRHVEKRVSFALGRLQQHVRGVTVWFDDINGPARGGADKSCRIAVALGGQRHSPVVVEEVQSRSAEEGYDALNDRFVNMFEAGIVDPTKVTRAALQNAASVAALMLTTETLITELKDEKKAVEGAVF